MLKSSKLVFVPKHLIYLLVAALLIGLDQYTKWVASVQLLFGVEKPVTSFFSLTLVHNYGAAFSMLADAGGWQRWLFTGISAVACCFFAGWILINDTKAKWLSVGLMLLLAGAAGNLIDRVYFGYVVDFLDFHWQGKHFPVFNLADCFVSVGVTMLLVDMLWFEPKRLKAKQSSHQEMPK